MSITNLPGGLRSAGVFLPQWTASASWVAGVDPNNVPIFVASAPCQVMAVVGRLEVAEGAAGSLTVNRAPSGTAIAGGTAVHSGSFDTNGAATENQYLTVAALADRVLDTGDSLGIVTTGDWTTSVGVISVTLAFLGADT